MSGHEHQDQESLRAALKAGHEVGEIQQRPVLISIIGLAVLSAATFAFIVFFFNLLDDQAKKASPPVNPMAQQAGLDRLPPEPRLQVDPWKDWNDFKMAQDRIVGSYGWVNRDSQTVHVPIDRAIDMVLEKGLPTRAGVATPPSLRMRAPVPSTEPAAPAVEAPHGGGGGH